MRLKGMVAVTLTAVMLLGLAPQSAMVAWAEASVGVGEKTVSVSGGDIARDASTVSGADAMAYPAWSHSYVDGDTGVAIEIEAPQGAFPKGVEVQIDRVEGDRILEALQEAAHSQDIKEEDVLAYNFNFFTPEADHMEPRTEISVRFRNLTTTKDGMLGAYHLENEDAAAEEVALSEVDEEAGSLGLMVDAFSIYAIVSNPAAETDGKIWIGDEETVTYASINEAVNAATAGSTIHIKGQFGENGSGAFGATISKNITLDIAGDTQMTGNSNYDGITITSGSRIQSSNGSTLTMSGFKTAFTLKNGGEMGDGTYIFQNNQSTVRGILIEGSVKGSSGRDKLIIKADDKSETNFYTGTATFENATVEVISQTRTWKDGEALNLKNTSMTLSGFGMGYYISGGAIVDSFLYMKDPGRYWGMKWGPTAIAFQGGGPLVSGSTIQLDYGHTAGLSIGLGSAATKLTFENCVLDFRNGGTGGLNVNTGDITLKNTLIKGDGKNGGALYGAQTNGKITFVDSSRVETPAKNDKDNGLGQGASNYVVLGGSYLVKYSTTYYSGAAVPTNGAENGNEKLDWVTLADTTKNQIGVLNRLGATYSYPVAAASSDGKKHVFVPTNKVTFVLDSATASFQDGTTADRTVKTIRGNELGMIEGETIPSDPANSNGELVFKGWYYTDGAGQEQPFTATTIVKADMTVKAKWDALQTLRLNASLDGDMLIGDDTEHTAPKQVKAKDTLDFIGRLNVEPIKAQIQTLKMQYGGNTSGISLQNVQSTFTAVLTFPAGLSMPETVTASLTENDLFQITSTVKSGNKVTVTMSLKKQYGRFDDLLTDVLGVPGTLDVIVPGIQVDETVADGAELTTLGSVNGGFSGKATSAGGNSQHYDLTWTAVQTPEGKDAVQSGSDNTTIQYTVKASNPTILATEETLEGDILIGEDTEHTTLHDAEAGEELTFTGRLWVGPIKDKINILRARYMGDLDRITTSDIASTFETVLALPAGLLLPAAPTATLTDNGLFEITSVTTQANTVKIRMTLKKNYTSFSELYADVIGVPDVLNVEVPGIRVSESNQDGMLLTLVGTVTGTFTGKAQAPSGKSEVYNFKWTGVQTPDGRDFTQLANDETIRYTVQVDRPQVISGDETLYGDILIGADTEHDALHGVYPGEELTYTGRLYVGPIKEKIQALSAAYGGNLNTITTENVESIFTTRLIIPAGMTLPAVPGAVLSTNPLFEIRQMEKDGNSIVITMVLKKNYSRFLDLQQDVLAVPDILDVEVAGIVVDAQVADGSRLTVQGMVDGIFKGKATSEFGRSQLYDFHWTAIQTDEGRDYIQNQNDSTIQYTVEARIPAVETREIVIHKVWVGKTEGQAVVDVLAGGQLVGTAILTQGNQWTHAMSLPKYDVAGNQIAYTVKEREIPGYTSAIQSKGEGSYEVTNTWKGEENQTPEDTNNSGGGNQGGESGGEVLGIRLPGPSKEVAKAVLGTRSPSTGEGMYWELLFTISLLGLGLIAAERRYGRKK